MVACATVHALSLWSTIKEWVPTMFNWLAVLELTLFEIQGDMLGNCEFDWFLFYLRNNMWLTPLPKGKDGGWEGETIVLMIVLQRKLYEVSNL